jgi:hypothetical protein
MEDNEKVDFGPLDPSRDEKRWQLLVGQTSRRAREKQQRVPSVSAQLVAWGPIAVAAAASLTLVVWGGAWLTQTQAMQRSRTALLIQQATQLSRWAMNDQLPPPEVVLQVIGDDHGDK